MVQVHGSLPRTFPIKVLELNGEVGPVYTRMEGIKNFSGDIVLCIDGDSVAENNWIEIMTKKLENDNDVLVGSWIKKGGANIEVILNMWNKYFCASKNKKTTKWLWGASFAFKDKDYVLKSLDKSVEIANELNFQKGKIAEDYWLALSINKIGNIEVTNKTWVTTKFQRRIFDKSNIKKSE